MRSAFRAARRGDGNGTGRRQRCARMSLEVSNESTRLEGQAAFMEAAVIQSIEVSRTSMEIFRTSMEVSTTFLPRYRRPRGGIHDLYGGIHDLMEVSTTSIEASDIQGVRLPRVRSGL
jgi:hypothetical protein